jgi:hypothetical protein
MSFTNDSLLVVVLIESISNASLGFVRSRASWIDFDPQVFVHTLQYFVEAHYDVLGWRPAVCELHSD